MTSRPFDPSPFDPSVPKGPLQYLSTESKPARVLDRLQDLCLIAILLGAPLIFYTHGYDVFEFNKMMAVRVLASLAALAFTAQWLLVRPFTLRRSPLDWPLLAFLGVSLVCTFKTASRNLSIHGVYEDFEGISTLVLYFFLCWWVLQRVSRPRQVHLFVGSVVLAGTLAGFYGILQNFQIDFVPWNPATYSVNRLFATMGNPNFLAAYLVMSLPFCLVVFLDLPEKIRTDKRVCAILMALGLVASLLLIVLFKIDYFNFSPALYQAPDTLRMLLSQKFVAAHLIVFFPLAAAVLLYFGRLKLIFLISMIFQVIAIAFTKSRGGSLALGASMAVLAGVFLWEWRKGTELFRRNRWWLASFAFILAVLILFYPPIRDTTCETLQRLAALSDLGHLTLTPRLYIWRSALQILKDHPWFGTGLDTFQVVFPRYRTALYWNLEWNGTPEKAHNVFLQTAATMGIFGLAAWFWLLGAFTTASWKVMRSAEHSANRLLVAACFAAVLAFLVQDCFSFTVVGYGSLFWMLLGLVPAMERTWKPAASVPPARVGGRVPAWHLPLLALAAAGLMAYSWQSTRAWIGDSFYKQGQVGMQAGQPGYSLNMYLKAAGRLKNFSQEDLQRIFEPKPGVPPLSFEPGLYPSQELYWVKMGIAYEAAATTLTNLQEKERAYVTALAVHQHTLEMNPINGYNYNNKGRVLKSMGETLGRRDYLLAAERHYEVAIRLDPHNAYFNLDMVLTWLDLDETAKALARCQELMVKFPDFSMPYNYAAYAALKMGDKKAATEYLKKAVSLDWKGETSGLAAAQETLKKLESEGKQKK